MKRNQVESELDIIRYIAQHCDVSKGGCWEWRGSKIVGYGIIQFRKRKWLTHRLIFSLLRGGIGSGLFVCHHCDNRKCCNPEHLFSGTIQDNLADMRRKGRESRGDSHPPSKITAVFSRQIKDLCECGRFSQKEIGKLYGLSQTSISDVKRFHTWKHATA